MQQINNLTNDADQLLTVTLTDGSQLQLEFIYRATIQRWSLNVNHPKLIINGFTICQGPNILRQWRNLIPFGIAIISNTGLDPLQSTDFQDGTVTVNILTPAEVQLVETQVLAPPVLVNA